jgi:hypothetical protein
MNSLKYKIESSTGSVLCVYDDHVVLTQEGVMGGFSRGLAGEKVIYYADITSVQFKNCGWSAGYMEFTFPVSGDKTGGPLGGMKNENRFTFGRPTIGAAKKLATEMEEVNDFIQEKVRTSKSPRTAGPVTSPADEILKFKQLFDMGAVTEEEYEAKKKQLLEIRG